MMFEAAVAEKTARGRGTKRHEKEDKIAVATAAFGKKYGLSPREQDVLELLIGRVVSAEEIAQKLALSRNTVRIHVKHINEKTGARSKAEVLCIFIKFLGRYYRTAVPA